MACRYIVWLGRKEFSVISPPILSANLFFLIFFLKLIVCQNKKYKVPKSNGSIFQPPKQAYFFVSPKDCSPAGARVQQLIKNETCLVS
jgi:hypothetical protein